MSQPRLVSLSLDGRTTVLNVYVTKNGHLECMLTTSTLTVGDDAKTLRKVMQWLQRNTNYIVAMNRDCSECPGCGIDCFTVMYDELGSQIGALKDSVEEVSGWDWDPLLTVTFEYEGQNYTLSSRYGYDLGYRWGFYGDGVAESHVRALVAQASVLWAKTEGVPNLPKMLDIALHPTNDLLDALRQVVYGLASVK